MCSSSTKAGNKRAEEQRDPGSQSALLGHLAGSVVYCGADLVPQVRLGNPVQMKSFDQSLGELVWLLDCDPGLDGSLPLGRS